MLECRSLSLSYGGVAALDALDLTAAEGSITAVIGPSGCGKTTLLRVIAGLEQPDAGSVEWQGGDLTSTPTHQRGFGLMFQDFALFPHRTVGENVAFGLHMAGTPPAAVAARVGEVLTLVGLDGFEDRTVTVLSGGEQQRVALARTLAPRPQLVMLDEPLGSLDRGLSERLVAEMREIFAGLGLTVLYVTHDQEEAFAIADHLVVMRAGRDVASGPTVDVWRNPGTRWVARFLGHENILDPGSPVGAVVLRQEDAYPAGGVASVAVPSGSIELIEDPAGPGLVESVTFRGGSYRVRISVLGEALFADTSLPPAVGAQVSIAVPPRAVIPLDD